MPGVFSKSNRPKRPGSYFNFVATAKDTILPSTSATVCILLTHDWGPYQTPTLVNSLSEFQSIFGPTTTTNGYKAVWGAFKGEGVTGFGGAGGVLVHRYGTAAVKATRTLQNTTPASAVTLTAHYEGAFGGHITVTVQDYAADAAKDQLIVYVDGVDVEEYVYTDTDIASLVSQINGNSDYITAAQVVTGVKLAYVANQALTGGDSGSTTIAPADFATALDAVEPERFSLMAVDDLAGQTWTSTTATAILATWSAWATNLNQKGKRFLSVVGGITGESVTTANTRSTTLNNSDFCNIGVGSVVDDTFGVLSTSQLAPRVAGVLAQRGESKSLTYARLQGVTGVGLPTESNILKAFDAGTIVLSRGSDPAAPIRIEKGLTTYTGGDSNKPYLIFRNPKYVRTTHGIETEITEYSDLNIIGKLQVSDSTRTFVVGAATTIIKARESRGILQPGSVISIDSDPPPTPEDEFIAVAYAIKFGRSVEQTFGTVTIG